MDAAAPTIEMMPIGTLRDRPNNARTHSRKQIRKIADSIREFGFVNPVLRDEENVIVCGHGRVVAARLAGLKEIPTICISHLSKAQIRAYVITDNQLASLSGWDREILSFELSSLAELAPDLDLTVTGFEVEQIQLLQDVSASKAPEDKFALQGAVQAGPATTLLGDVWNIGPHRLRCGNALERSDYKDLLGDERADVVITDPPYNVRIQGHVSGLGLASHREFVMASGEMTRPQFQRFLSAACGNMARFSRSGSLHYIFIDWRSVADLLMAGEEAYDDLLNLIVWSKSNAGMGTFYRSQHELVALFKRGKRPHVNNVELGANGRYRTNVWSYPGANSFGGDRDTELAWHPTVKNTEMIVDAIKDSTDPGQIVLDPFGGSGTTLVAANRCRRVARLMELDPSYCDLIIERSASEGMPVSLKETGESYATVGARRLEASAGGDWADLEMAS